MYVYIYIYILHVYIYILHVYIYILHVYILHVYIYTYIYIQPLVILHRRRSCEPLDDLPDNCGDYT